MSTNTFFAHGGVNTTLTTTDEIIVATLTGVSTGRATDVKLSGWVQLTTGTGTTGVQLRVRRGSTTGGTLIDEVNTVTAYAAAGSTEERSINVVDEALDAAGVTYVLTVSQIGATANGTALQATLEATVER